MSLLRPMLWIHFGRLRALAYFVPCYGCIWAHLKERSLLRPMLWIHFRPRGCHWLTSSHIMDAFGRPSIPKHWWVLSSSHVMDSFGPIVGVHYVRHVPYFVPCLWIHLGSDELTSSHMLWMHLGPKALLRPMLWIHLGPISFKKKDMSSLRPMLWIYLGLVLDMSHTIIAWLTSSQTIGFIWARQNTPKRVELWFLTYFTPNNWIHLGQRPQHSKQNGKKPIPFFFPSLFHPS